MDNRSKRRGGANMGKNELNAVINGLIALCQANDLLPTTTDELADKLQSIASSEMYISKAELVYYLR